MTFIVLNIISFMRYLSSLLFFFLLVSCKSVEVVGRSEVQDVQKFRSVDTVVVRDSVFVSERQKDDTIYLTRVEWRDRWRTRIERDTVVDVRIEKEVVQLPPERYVPPFYKRCTIALWVIIALVIGYWAMRRWAMRRWAMRR